MLTAYRYADHAHHAPIGTLRLTYEDRFLRRKVLVLEDNTEVLVDLAQTTSLDHGGVLITDLGEITIVAAPEPLLAVTGPDLVRIAWHIGNRHTPCQIAENRLLIQRDRVMRDMLQRIGATVTEVTEPFTPEGGAYGHGRTHGHDHGATHGPDAEGQDLFHAHDHSHDHAHDHAHDKTHDHSH